MIKEEKMMSAYDLIETYCELIVESLPIIESQKYVNLLSMTLLLEGIILLNNSFINITFLHKLRPYGRYSCDSKPFKFFSSSFADFI